MLRLRLVAVAAVLGLGFVPLGCGSNSKASDVGDGGPDESVCNKPAAQTGFLQSVSLTVSGTQRLYSLYLPTTYDGSKRFPVVLVLHGDGGTGQQIRGDLNVEAAAANGAIFAYPNGVSNTWDTDSWVDGNRDLPFLDALIAELGKNYCTQSKRVFVTGHSRGAYMANQLACWRGGVIRAVASHSGGGPFDGTSKHFDDNGVVACPGSPIPALMLHGDADNVVDLSEGQKSLTYWSYADKCMASTTATTPSPCLSQNACTTSPVTFCKIPGLTHAVWSQAPATIWSFFDSLQ
jgi:polyhydroxybutyrate depolymerase